MLAGGWSRTRFNGQLAPGSHTTTVEFHQARDWSGDPTTSHREQARYATCSHWRRVPGQLAQPSVAPTLGANWSATCPPSPSPPSTRPLPPSILDSVRRIACGIYPLVLADFGVAEALRAQAVRASVLVSLAGAAPRSIQLAETALYFSRLEAIQNVANHAGRTAHASLGRHHEHGVLAVRVEDEGRGFDSEDTPGGVGLRNTHGRTAPTPSRSPSPLGSAPS